MLGRATCIVKLDPRKSVAEDKSVKRQLSFGSDISTTSGDTVSPEGSFVNYYVQHAFVFAN